ncbi:hypothetical protein [Dyadobacter sp. 32]|uniref:hypothetical protein n=1 Tax=Dyadobacter sp. 32 TaxID=538966 RepID=UPI0039C68BF6
MNQDLLIHKYEEMKITFMRRVLLFFMVLFGVLLCADQTLAQRSKFGTKYIPPFGVVSVMGGVGVAYYTGELSDGVNMKHLGLGPSLSLGGLYRLTENVSARAEIRFYQVSQDRQFSKKFEKNLSFRTRNPDISLGIQADLFSFNQRAKVNPYLFGGVGVTYLTPKAKLDGTWHSLAPLTTEGASYNRIPLVLTGGLGVSMSVSDRLGVGLELCNNFLQSDYLDDVSTFYPNPDALPSDLARRLSDRSSEIGQEAQQPGWIRGNPKSNDAYLFFQLRATYLIGNRMQAIERRKTKCPKF